MARHCPACNRVYPSDANFCAACGAPLVPPPVSPASRNAKLALAVAISALATCAVLAVTRSRAETEGRVFNLPPAKAAALFQVLRPQDVKVLVRRDAGHVHITGTRKECDVLADFSALITRYSGKPSCQLRDRMEQARRRWTTHRTYKLPKGKAKALFDALAPDDVPVLVSRSGRRVKVDASPEDQDTVHHVVEILRGRRL